MFIINFELFIFRINSIFTLFYETTFKCPALVSGFPKFSASYLGEALGKDLIFPQGKFGLEPWKQL